MSDAFDEPVLLGYRKNGLPIYQIQGGAVDPPQLPAPDSGAPNDPGTGDDPAPADPPEGDTDPPEPNDLAAELKLLKSKHFHEKNLRKVAEAKVAALQAKATAPPAADDNAPTPEQIREAARNEARAEVAKDRALDRVEVLAAKAFADPADARMFLAANVDDFLDNGQPDPDAINHALAELLKARPYLASGTPKKWTANGDGGTRGGQPKDLAARIAEAQKTGNVAEFVALQNQKFQTPTT
jgi:hypothetical protein